MIRAILSTAVLLVASVTAANAIGTPVAIGNNGSSGSSINSLSTTVTTAVAVNNTVIATVVLYTSNRTFTVTVADSAGNTYTNNADITDSSSTRTLVFSAPVTTALTTSNSITVSFTHSVQYINVSNFSVSGLLTASPVDKTSTSTGTSTSVSSGTTGTTTQASELLIGALGIDFSGNGTATLTPGSGYAALPANAISGSWGIYPEYEIVSSTGAYSATGTMSGNVNDWAAAIVTYKAAASSSGRKGQTIMGKLDSIGGIGSSERLSTEPGDSL